jgi:hypothetical protein
MKEGQHIITSYCKIRNGNVELNKQVFFKSSRTGVDDFLTDIYRHLELSYPKFFKMDNLCKLGFVTAEILLKDKKPFWHYAPEEVGLIVSNAASSIETDRNHQQSVNDRSNYFPSPSVFVYTLPNIVIGEICIRHKFHGEGSFFIEEHFNGPLICNYTNRLLADDLIKCCITGWIEMDGAHYESVLFLIEKATRLTKDIAIFEPAIINGIYTEEI